MPRVVFFSDSHIGSPQHRAREFIDMLERIRGDPPDALIGIGDIWDLWVRDPSALVFQESTYRLVELLYHLDKLGVLIVLIAGNHDWHMRDANIDPRLQPEWGVLRPRAWIEVGGTIFYVEHGHQCEIEFNSVTNELLSCSNDYQGEDMLNIWDNMPDPTKKIFSTGLGYYMSNLSRPGITARNKIDRIESCLEKRASEDGHRYDWIVYGHTHVPKVDYERRIANPGAFDANVASYLEYDNGRMILHEY